MARYQAQTTKRPERRPRERKPDQRLWERIKYQQWVSTMESRA